MQRQRTAGAERLNRHGVLDAAGVGIGHGNRVAGQQGTHIDVVAGLATGRYRGSGRRLIGQCLRHLIGEFVELVLCLRQNQVAQLQISTDLAGLDRIGGDQVGAGTGRRDERDRAGAVLTWIGAPQRSRREGADIAKLKLRGLVAANQLLAGAGKDGNLVVCSLDDIDVHHLRDLRDVLVALVLKVGRRTVECRHALQLLIDLGDLLQRRIHCGHAGRDALLRLRAQLLDGRRHRIEILRHLLGGADDLRLRRVRRGVAGQRLQGGREIVVDRVERGGRARRAVDLLKLLVNLRAGVGVGIARRFGPQLVLQQRVEIAVDAVDVDAYAGLSRNCELDLVDGSIDVTGRVGVRHVSGDHREALLRGVHASQGGR